MLLQASCTLEFNTPVPVASVFMLRPMSGKGQFIIRDEYLTHPYTPITEYTDVFGNLCQRLVVPAGSLLLQSRVMVDCADTIDVNIYAPLTPVEQLPDNVLHFLLPSRYCESDQLTSLAASIVAHHLPGYPQVEAIRQWIHQQVKYQYGSSDSSTSAADIVVSKTGICRDFAHLGIALCRSLDIPARMVVGYLYQLNPMDLHAWFEAYVGGRWYCFDATQPAPRGRRITVAYGRDAADVAFATHFGQVTLAKMEIGVEQVKEP